MVCNQAYLYILKCLQMQAVTMGWFVSDLIVPFVVSGSGDLSLYCACTFCGKTMRRSSLKRHIEDRHLPSRAACCQYCSKVFRSNNSLQNHLSIYHRNAEKIRKQNKSVSESRRESSQSPRYCSGDKIKDCSFNVTHII